MKIDNEHIRPIDTGENRSKPAKAAGDGFGDVFGKIIAEQMSCGESDAARVTVKPLMGDPLAENVAPCAGDQAGSKTVAGLQSILNKLEQYAERLQAVDEETALKQAYGVLESISKDVDALKKSAAENGHQGLQSMVDELESITVVERIRFNSGRYS